MPPTDQLSTTRRLAWMDRAACRGYPLDWWYPELRGRTHVRLQAQAVCARCPVRLDCIAYAMRVENLEPRGPYQMRFGIWGGFTPADRRRIAKGQPA